jgi:predicted DNA-binding transcriptional regulator AlpA
MNERILVNDKEAAHMLCMGRSTFWAGVKAELLPQPVKIGGLTRWRVADLLQQFQASPTTTPSTSDVAASIRPDCKQPEPHLIPYGQVAAQ